MRKKITKLVKSTQSYGPASLDRIPYLDGWRGLAILLVLVAHFFPIPNFVSGLLGVHIFFVLSGLLMSQILFVKKVPLRKFYQRRISRIMPVFILFTISIYSLSAWMGITFSIEEIISTLFFLRTYIPAEPGIWDGPVPIDHLWTLNIEEHSYILMSLLTIWAFTRKSPGFILLSLGLASQITIIYYLKNPDIAAKNFELRTECALSFIFYSAGYNLIKHHFCKYVSPWFPILTLTVATLCYCNIFPWWANFFTPALLAFTVNHLSEVWSPFLRILSLPALRLLGLWSYSIYIWQQPFAKFQGLFLPSVAFILAMITGIASFYLFENPTRKWINSHWKCNNTYEGA